MGVAVCTASKKITNSNLIAVCIVQGEQDKNAVYGSLFITSPLQ
jgi:hypothetical protein